MTRSKRLADGYAMTRTHFMTRPKRRRGADFVNVHYLSHDIIKFNIVTHLVADKVSPISSETSFSRYDIFFSSFLYFDIYTYVSILFCLFVYLSIRINKKKCSFDHSRLYSQKLLKISTKYFDGKQKSSQIFSSDQCMFYLYRTADSVILNTLVTHSSCFRCAGA